MSEELRKRIAQVILSDREPHWDGYHKPDSHLISISYIEDGLNDEIVEAFEQFIATDAGCAWQAERGYVRVEDGLQD